MPRARGVKFEVVRLELSDGDWIDVRRVLTVGEDRDLVSLAVRGYRPDGTADLDTKLLSFLAAATYITGWSLVGVDGLPIPWVVNASVTKRVEVLRTLDSATMREIDEAIDAHRMREATAKNAHSGDSGTGTTSPSAAA
jgi:hypothetical protein